MEKNRILVVDDEDLIQYALGHALRNEGFDVSTVGTAEEALSKLERDPYDLCFLDRALPGIDGLTALERMKDAWPATKVVVMTGTRVTAEEQALIERLADLFLEKPFDLNVVRKIVSGLLQSLQGQKYES